jgi:putative spermidine/putrescine transport system substrate-binding protein
MKKFVAALLALSLLMGLVSLSALAEEKTKLVISAWPTNIDLIQKNVYKPFEEANNCEIVVELGSNGDRLTKLRENPSAYDIVYFSDKYVKTAVQEGLLENFDASRLTNLGDLYDFCQQPNPGYGPGYTVTGFGICYDPDVIKTPITKWADLWREDVVSQLTVPAITVTSGPYFVEVAGKVAGTDVSVDDNPAFEKLKELSAGGAYFYEKSGDIASKFQLGEVAAAVVQDFEYSTILAACPQVKYVMIPEEGTFLGINQINIVKGSKNQDLAYKFIDWAIGVEAQTAQALDKVEAPANTKVVLTAEQAEGLAYGEPVFNSTAPNWDLIMQKNAEWVERYNTEIYLAK